MFACFCLTLKDGLLAGGLEGISDKGIGWYGILKRRVMAGVLPVMGLMSCLVEGCEKMPYRGYGVLKRRLRAFVFFSLQSVGCLIEGCGEHHIRTTLSQWGRFAHLPLQPSPYV